MFGAEKKDYGNRRNGCDPKEKEKKVIGWVASVGLDQV